MKIPGREFHYEVRSYLVRFQNVFVLVIPALFHPNAEESMGSVCLFVCLFSLQKIQLVKGKLQDLKGRLE